MTQPTNHGQARTPRAGLRCAALALGLGAVLVSVGCSTETTGGEGGGGSDEPPPEGACYQNPLACEAGTTCAFDDEHGESMSCLPAGAGAEDDACRNVEGAPECGEGLVCLHLSGEDGGLCARYCGAEVTCRYGLTCAKVDTSGGHSFWACVDL